MIRSAALALVCATFAVGCAENTSEPTHTPDSDCAHAKRPNLADGKSVLTCERDALGYRWTASQTPADLATCPRNVVLELGCVRGERGRVAMRTADADGGFSCSDWSPVCR